MVVSDNTDLSNPALLTGMLPSSWRNRQTKTIQLEILDLGGRDQIYMENQGNEIEADQICE